MSLIFLYVLEEAMSDIQIQLRSIIHEDLSLEITLVKDKIPTPGPNEVLVQLQAAPINPSDMLLLFGPVDPNSIAVTNGSEGPVVSGRIFDGARDMIHNRIGQSMSVGNEGAGLVVEAGESEEAQSLKGKTVGVFGGGMYSQYRCVNARQCLPLKDGISAVQGASCFVNPMTALGMVETMRMEGHSALVHTAAASNLGKMLNRICISDKIDLVNIVRSEAQKSLLDQEGSQHTIDSSEGQFRGELIDALSSTGATLAFDAVGGGKLAGQILACMEAAAQSNSTGYSPYGSDINKQVYIYGGLDLSPTVLNRNFGLSWSIGGWLLMSFMVRAGEELVTAMKTRVADEITTTFASSYAREVSLTEALSPDVIALYSKRSTGEKILIKPNAG